MILFINYYIFNYYKLNLSKIGTSITKNFPLYISDHYFYEPIFAAFYLLSI